MDFSRMEFELAVQEVVRAELESIERQRRFRRRRAKRPREHSFRPGRPWWFPLATVALAVINTILWPMAFGLVAGTVVVIFLLLQSLWVR